ncbi:MAG: hypothetical protein OXN89_13720 [Bryobacterales bacterium]|nr:hypothetical protein [Bryobacterales bacterium]
MLDWEGDVFALFAEMKRLGDVDLPVRAKHNRALAGGASKLFGDLRQASLEVEVLRQSARRGTHRQKKSAARAQCQGGVAFRDGAAAGP